MSTTQLIGNNKQPTSKSTKYRRYHSAHQGSGRIQTKQPNPTPFKHHPTTNTLNQQTLSITNNNQTQTLHVTNKRPYTKHSKYKLRKPRTALVLIKVVLHFLTQISMYCALSQNCQQLFWKIVYGPYSKFSKELKNGIEILGGQVVFPGGGALVFQAGYHPRKRTFKTHPKHVFFMYENRP